MWFWNVVLDNSDWWHRKRILCHCHCHLEMIQKWTEIKLLARYNGFDTLNTYSLSFRHRYSKARSNDSQYRGKINEWPKLIGVPLRSLARKRLEGSLLAVFSHFLARFFHRGFSLQLLMVEILAWGKTFNENASHIAVNSRKWQSLIINLYQKILLI